MLPIIESSIYVAALELLILTISDETCTHMLQQRLLRRTYFGNFKLIDSDMKGFVNIKVFNQPIILYHYNCPHCMGNLRIRNTVWSKG